MITVNEDILNLFQDFKIGGESIPVAFQHYEGHGEPYVVFSRENDDGSYSADDRIQAWVTYYDFDIYSKTNYVALADAVRDKLEEAGWTWQPSRSNWDMYEADTGYYHVTLNFAHERSW